MRPLKSGLKNNLRPEESHHELSTVKEKTIR